METLTDSIFSVQGRISRSIRLLSVPSDWKVPSVHTECTLHQISPYIGKLKSLIARRLITRLTDPGDLVVDPFAGSGTIPLEAALLGRRVFAADISPYAEVLTRGKLLPPPSLEKALSIAEEVLSEAEAIPALDQSRIPMWVRRFFHPKTLKEAINFGEVCRNRGDDFLLACLLGILHHQRPGFLSFPSSHLVPYLRDRKYPKNKYPELYRYRELRPRLLAKIRRVYKRFPKSGISVRASFYRKAVEELVIPRRFDCLITSPPYMNALDYGRDNRLRLWFVRPESAELLDGNNTQQKEGFRSAVSSLAEKIEMSLKSGGKAVFVVGEKVERTFEGHPAQVILDIVAMHAPSLKLVEILTDEIPDIRRARRECRGIKNEHILVFARG